MFNKRDQTVVAETHNRKLQKKVMLRIISIYRLIFAIYIIPKNLLYKES